MALHGGELARRLVDRLYAATTTKEARLCKASLEALEGAHIEGGVFAEQAEKPILKRWSKQTAKQPIFSEFTVLSRGSHGLCVFYGQK